MISFAPRIYPTRIIPAPEPYLAPSGVVYDHCLMVYIGGAWRNYSGPVTREQAERDNDPAAIREFYQQAHALGR